MPKGLCILKPCEQCWETFEPYKTAKQKYCSLKCATIAKNERQQKERKQAMIDGIGCKAYLKLRFEILRRDGFICQYCGRTAKDEVEMQVDHIIPESRGGTYSMDNLITACFECNNGKSDILLSKREIQKLLEKQTKTDSERN